MPDERDVVPAASAFKRLRLLTTSKTIAMVGLSPDPMRPSISPRSTCWPKATM